jgi:hypothetical protein
VIHDLGVVVKVELRRRPCPYAAPREAVTWNDRAGKNRASKRPAYIAMRYLVYRHARGEFWRSSVDIFHQISYAPFFGAIAVEAQ